MTVFSFQHPYFFFLLLLLAPVLVYAWRRKMPTIRVSSIRTASEVRRKAPASADLKKLLPFLCYALAGLLLVIALARPREGLETIRRHAEGIDIIIAIDLSGSMKIIDVPKTYRMQKQVLDALDAGTLKDRIGTAKQEILKFIEARPNDRIGLIAFAPQPFNACPPTLDHAFLMERVKELAAGVIGEQTNIAAPIASAIHRLKESGSKRKIIVLFTDGRNNVMDKVTPRQAAALGKPYDISIYTVGIGSPRAYAPQETFMGGRQLVPIRDEFDEPLLKELAASTGGKYYKAEDAESMENAMNEINRLEKTSFEQQSTVNWRELAPPFMLGALLLLLLGFFLEHTFCLRVP